ncbi:hypothetical protein JCM11251_007042 [Rhodosporidiobolus azoricus]
MEWADLVSTLRKTRGDVPPPLVGASVTLLGDALYVFGGRPTDRREMVNSLYCLDLRTLSWSLVSSPDAPAPRYFHSCGVWGEKLVIFGGQRFVPPAAAGQEGQEGGGEAPSQGYLETLDELVVYDTVSRRWFIPSVSTRTGVRRPSPRYAHLSVCTTLSSPPPPGFSSDSATLSSRLTIIGGQDLDNNYISDLAVLDLDRMEWVAEAPFPRKAGSYRSVAAAAGMSVKPLEEKTGLDGTVVHSSHGEVPTEEEPEPVFVFTNTNLSNPRRDLDMIPSPHDLTTPAYFSLTDSMVGEPSYPPGLRFPQAYILGTHLVLSGAHVGVNRAEFNVWAVELGPSGAAGKGKKLPWTRIPVDKVLGNGSWGPALGWRNTLVVVGDRAKEQIQSYESRETNFTDVAFVDLEGFGIYSPPPQALAPTQQSLGLLTLSSPQLFDYEFLCSDKERLGCSRKTIEARWPWFAEELAAVEAKASAAIEAREQRTATNSGSYGDDTSDEEPIDSFQRITSPAPRSTAAEISHAGLTRDPSRLFPITSRTLELPLPSSEVRALLQYFHTLALSTPLQRSLPVLTSLLGFTKAYDTVLPALRALVIHALHESLSEETAAKIYEAAALGGCVALQVRATQVMLAARRPSASSTPSMSRQGSSEPLAPPLSRYSNNSQDSSRLSAQSSADSHSSLPWATSSTSSMATTPASSVFGSTPYSLAPPSSLPCPSSTIPPLPSLPLHPSGLPSSPLPPLPTFAAAPIYGSGARGPDGRSTSLSAASDASSYAPSSASGHSPAPSPAPTAQYPPPRGSSAAPPPTMIAASTPARIAEAWREGEERDRRQRAEAARLAAEADMSRLRIGERKGSIAPSTLSSIEESRRGSEDPNAASTYSFGATPAVTGLVFPLENDGSSIKTSSSSGGMSTSTRQSAEKAAAVATQAATVTTKAVKKGFLAGFLSQPVIHNAGTKSAPAAVGPPVRKSYPAPRTRKEVEEAKKAAKLASDSGSSRASVRS